LATCSIPNGIQAYHVQTLHGLASLYQTDESQPVSDSDCRLWSSDTFRCDMPLTRSRLGDTVAGLCMWHMLQAFLALADYREFGVC